MYCVLCTVVFTAGPINPAELEVMLYTHMHTQTHIHRYSLIVQSPLVFIADQMYYLMCCVGMA